ncbi:MAG: alpha-amylase family glycosyl hydrolase [Candidatus Neomarinimicrobiota bacterium]|nr:alpha-amylase family glycosyl hydrolase [Candidatus Neomarinimicrobiota bacterium]
MKRKFYKSSLSYFFLIAFSFSQSVIEHEPLFPSIDKPIRIIFYADRGTKGLMNFSGDVYAHTGVITSKSSTPSDWRYVKTNWGQNTNETKLTRTSNNVYELKIENIRSYYGLGATEEVLRLAFVFRSSDTSREGKDYGGKDIFVDLGSEGLKIVLVEPLISAPNPLLVTKDTTVTLKAIANASSETINTFQLWINNTLIQTATSDTIKHKLNMSLPNHWDVKFLAESSGEDSDSLELRLVYLKPPETAQVPDGAEDGITLNHDGSATFVLHAPYKKSVFLIGDFNDWKVDNDFLLKRTGGSEDEKWWITYSNFESDKVYRFQYIVDGNLRIADPYSEFILEPEYTDALPKNVYPDQIQYPKHFTTFDVSVLDKRDNTYNWNTKSYQIAKPSELNIYEALVRDFSFEHRFKSIIDSLDYLQRLGINALQLMPINEFQGNDSWGYNPSFLFAVDKYYGSKNELKSLIDSCHARNIAVIIDLVINHSYGNSPFYRLYNDGKPLDENPWFNRDHNFANTDAHWGYDWNHESIYTKKLFKRAIAFWMNEFKVDGFRFDFTKGIGNNYKPLSDPWGSRYDTQRVNLLKEIAKNVWDINEDGIVIFEHLSEDKEEKELAEHGVLMWSNGNHNYSENLMGYTSGSKSSLSWTYFKNRGWSVPNSLVYMESHDEERIVYKASNFGATDGTYNIKNLEISLERLKTLGSIYFLLPGPKMIWQFGELGYDISINQNGRLGRKPILWNYYDVKQRRDVYDTWSYFMKLRKSFPIFSDPESKIQTWLNTAVKKIYFNRENENAILIANFDTKEARTKITLPHGDMWYNPFLNDSVDFDTLDISINLPAGRFILLTDFETPRSKKDITLLSLQDEGPSLDNFQFKIYPNPSNSTFVINYSLSEKTFVSISVFDVLGRKVIDLASFNKSKGVHQIAWNGRDSSNNPSAPGVYFVKVKAGKNQINKKIVLLK